jgi:hypothetical protein
MKGSNLFARGKGSVFGALVTAAMLALVAVSAGAAERVVLSEYFTSIT